MGRYDSSVVTEASLAIRLLVGTETIRLPVLEGASVNVSVRKIGDALSLPLAFGESADISGAIRRRIGPRPLIETVNKLAP